MSGINEIDPDEISPPVARPKTGAVLSLVAAAALIFSYLTSYCLVNALVGAEVMTRWPPGHDPRPKLLVGQFIVLLALFFGVGAYYRWTSRRQLKRIDEMEAD